MLKIRRLMKSQGFTLVELLIVIAVIGILAVAVLAALDPIEQLKKARDTGRVADSRELYSAYNRYYASYNCYPQELSGNTCLNVSWGFRPVTSNAELLSGLAVLISNGELKAAFSNKQSVTQGQLWSFQSGDDSMAVCFTPESKSARAGGMGQILASNFSQTINCAGAYVAGNLDGSCVLCVR
jgi:prepilin-type N-terminal cleavage/methylation domain-containing protein